MSKREPTNEELAVAIETMRGYTAKELGCELYVYDDPEQKTVEDAVVILLSVEHRARIAHALRAVEARDG